MKLDLIKQISILFSMSIISALKKMDEVRRKLLIVVDQNSLFVGLLSIGDLQRAIIAGKSLETPIIEILRSDVKIASDKDNIEEVKSFMKKRRNDFMPIVNDAKQIVDVIFWEDLQANVATIPIERFNLPVIIMAGGKGERLKPLTNVLPKPLIPIGSQSMLEDIMDRFFICGCDKFYISLNYKADFIKSYLVSANKPYSIFYFQEEKPLGTAGSLHLLKERIYSTFFVSNCDIIVNDDYSEILKYHREKQNEITIVAALKNYAIPYGILEAGKDGLLTNIQEKPNLAFKINTGMYILEPHLIEEIPEDTFYHITYLIESLMRQGRKVGVFPISEGSWTDIGNWKEYINFCKIQ